MFTDGTKIYDRLNKDDNRGEEAIQQDLDSLDKNGRIPGYCASMPPKKRGYYLGDQLIPKTEEEKDLGVIIIDNCKPTQQCSKAAAKATSSLGLIRKSFKYIDQDSFSVLYHVYRAYSSTSGILCPSLESPWKSQVGILSRRKANCAMSKIYLHN